MRRPNSFFFWGHTSKLMLLIFTVYTASFYSLFMLIIGIRLASWEPEKASLSKYKTQKYNIGG
jgi:hypothetical protein